MFRKRPGHRLILEALEERIFFDANPLLAAVDTPVDQPPADQPSTPEPADAPESAPVSTEEHNAEPETEVPAGKTVETPGEGQSGEESGTVSANEDNTNTTAGEETATPDNSTPATASETPASVIAEEHPDLAASGSPTETQGPTDSSETSETTAIDPMIGENFTFTVNLDNPSGTTLYGPYIDLYFESAGDDGDGDGVIFDNAKYLGTNLNATTLTYTGSPLLHPFAVNNSGNPLTISTRPDGTALQVNDTVVVLEMPFGSFTPSQPPAEVVVTAHISSNSLVDAGGGSTYDYDVQVTNGFRYGTDALNNPLTDPSVTFQTPGYAALQHATQTFRPEVVRFNKTYIGPEHETATGPNYVRTYSIDIDVATGQTVTNLRVVEHLPNDIWYLGDGTIVGGTVVSSPGAGVHSGQDLVIDVGTVVGGAGIDRTVTFQYYVPYVDAANSVIIARTDGSNNDDRQIINDAEIICDWDPTDPDDLPVIGIVMDAEVDAAGNISGTPNNDEEFDAKAIAIQKGVAIELNSGAAGYNPGDIVRYTLNFQVSDYFNFGNITATDILPDGLDFLTAADGYAPTYDIDAYGLDYSGSWNYGVNLFETIVAGDDIRLVFNVSGVAGYGANGILRGTLSDTTNNSQDGSVGVAATGTITYYARIKEQYDSESTGTNPLDKYVDQGDIFDNSVTISGTIYTGDPDAPDNLLAGDQEQDGSGAGFSIATGSVVKSVYAINGANPDPDGDGVYHMKPGDIVTYRLRYTLPTSDFESFVLDDYLPLPVLDVDHETWQAGIDGGGTPIYTTSYATVPLSGHSRLMNTDTFFAHSGLVPTISSNSGANSVVFTYGEYHDNTSPVTAIDLVFTVTVSSDPFADGLYLTNQVRAIEDGTPGTPNNSDQIVQIVLDEPLILEIVKDAVPTSGIDAGDVVSFAVEIENTGHANAFDIIIKDDLPAGYDSLATGFTVSIDGVSLVAGIGYIWTGGGVDGNIATVGDNFFADPGIDRIYGTGDDGYVGGIELVDGGTGSLAPGKSIRITYNLQAAATIQPLQALTNTATLTNYAGAEGAADHTTTDLSDTATVTAVAPTIAKNLVGTEITEPGNVALNQAVIGEFVTYTITLTVPEGQMGQTGSIANGTILRDTLDNGLAFVDVTSVTASAGLSFSGPAGTGLPTTGINPANSVVSQSGGLIEFNLGQITNANTDNSSAETVVITYRAVVLNTNVIAADSADNQAGQQRNNSLDIDWNNGSGVQDLTDVTADNITIVEPTLITTKLVANVTDGTGFVAAATGDSGDTMQYRITISNGNAAADTTAFDISLNDLIPASMSGLSIVSVTSAGTGTTRLTGAATLDAAFQLSGNTLSMVPAANIDMEKDSTITITVQGTFTGATGDVIPNTAEVRWTSMDGNVVDRSAYNTASDERDGTGGLLASGALNDYRVQSTANIESPPLVYKTIIATSEASTTPNPIAVPGVLNANAAIGELVRYRLYVSLGEGDTDNFQIQDNLPDGIRFLNDGTARWTFIASTAGNLTSSTITPPPGITISGLGSSATVAGNGTTLASLASGSITGTFNDDNIAASFNGTGTSDATLYASGQDVFFRFGNIINNDRDTDLEFAVVEFNALVENIAGNQAGMNLNNSFAVLADTQLSGDGNPGYISVTIDNDRSGTRSAGDTAVSATDADNNAGTGPNTPALSNNATLTVVEPQLTINKTVTATTGSIVTYRVVVTNTGAANAFDATVTDILPTADLDLIVGSITITPAGGATAGTANHSDVANRMEYADLDIPVGDSVTISYQANVLTTTSGATTIDNTVSTTWTSLPDTRGTAGTSGFFGTTAGTLGNSGDPTGERNGSDGIGGLNDYAASDTERLGSLGDRVYLDLDGDGVQDAGESGIVGVPVTVRWEGADGVFGNGDDSVITVTTGANGAWTIAGLPIGTGQDFRVSVPTTIGGMAITDVRDNGGAANTNPDALGIGISAVTLSGLDAATSNNRLQDFGYRGTAALGDRIYIDADGDGVQDGNGLEPSLPGVLVSLTWAGLDGDINTGADNITFTTTSTNPASPGDPNYLFQFLPSGNFTVAASAAGGSGGVPDNMALTDSVSGNGLSADASVTTNLAIGENELTMDFGYRGNSSIGDFVWYDADGDGNQDAGEPGIPGVSVTLLWSGPDGDISTGGDNVTFTTTTAANGSYLFPGLPVFGINDRYRVTVTPEASYPSQTYDSDGLGTANQSTLDLPPNASNLVQDFGYRGTTTATAQLGDLIWEDLNANGRQDAGEPGVSGVTVKLFFAGADGLFQAGELVTPILTTLSASNGSFLFDSLATGTYRLQFGTSDGTTTFARTLQNSSVAVDATDSDADTITGFTGDYVLASGGSDTTVDQGLYQPASIGDRIYFDYDGDGIQDGDEPGIPNVPVEVIWFGPDGILGGTDDQTFITTSGANGIWAVNGLPPGNYQVTATPSTGSGLTLTDSLDNGFLNAISPLQFSVTYGVNRSDLDFGFQGTGSIGDQLWIDGNRNGLVDGGESGIPGVQLTIGIDLNGDGSPDFTTTTSTDGAGLYLFSNLPAGRHTITINPATLPPDLQQVYDPDGGMDNLTVVNLGAGENARYADFGYAKPVVQPPDPRPPVLPPPPLLRPPDFITDPFFMDRVYGHRQTGLEAFLEGPSLFERRADIYQEPPLLVSPIYSGHAEPGTTITLNLYDHQGHLIGYQTVMADTGGNWLANFSGILLNELPHLIEIDQTMASYNNSTAGGFNMRTYFTPSFGAAPFTRTALSVNSIFASLPGTVLDSLDQHTPSPLRLGWDDFYGYEFFAPSTNPAENHL